MKCFKQNVRETTEILQKRWSYYKNNVRKFLRGESCMQQHLFEHFQSPGHTDFIEDVCITLIDNIDPFISTKRKDYWGQTHKNSAPHDLNIEKGVVFQITFSTFV